MHGRRARRFFWNTRYNVDWNKGNSSTIVVYTSDVERVIESSGSCDHAIPTCPIYILHPKMIRINYMYNVMNRFIQTDLHVMYVENNECMILIKVLL